MSCQTLLQTDTLNIYVNIGIRVFLSWFIFLPDICATRIPVLLRISNYVLFCFRNHYQFMFTNIKLYQTFPSPFFFHIWPLSNYKDTWLEAGLSPPVKYFTDRSKAVLLCGYFMFFSVLCLLWLCTRLFICTLWSPAGKGLTSWLSFVVSNCEFVTFPLVSWVRCGTWLHQFLIFAPSLTLSYV